MIPCRTQKTQTRNQKPNHQKKQLDRKSHQKNQKNNKKLKINKNKCIFLSFLYCFLFFLVYLVGVLFYFCFFSCCFLDFAFLVCSLCLLCFFVIISICQTLYSLCCWIHKYIYIVHTFCFRLAPPEKRKDYLLNALFHLLYPAAVSAFYGWLFLFAGLDPTHTNIYICIYIYTHSTYRHTYR